MLRHNKQDDESRGSSISQSTPSPRVINSAAQEQADVRRRSDRETLIGSRIAGSSSKRSEIGHLDNAWRNEKMTADVWDESQDGSEEERSCRGVTTRMEWSKRWRRSFAVLLLLLGCFVYVWTSHLWPAMQYDYMLKVGFLRQPEGTYGLGIGGDALFARDKIVQLDDALLPGGAADPEGVRRLIFVGDIHGCKDELWKLLHHVNFDIKTDHLIATGDVISKGPDSAGVVDELIRLKATSVRGNHEDRILTLAGIETEKYGEPEQLSKTAKKDSKLLKSLKQKHIEYLHDMPLILRIPPLPLAAAAKVKHAHIRSEILVVHAGLVPALPLAKQDPYFVMNMRSLAQTTHVPSDKPANKHARLLPWVDSWNWYHDRLSHDRVFTGWHVPEPGLELDDGASTWGATIAGYFQRGIKSQTKLKAQTVVYGHDSRAGFVNKKWSKGLDSRCVAGGSLTAMVLDARGKESFFSVHCKDYT